MTPIFTTLKGAQELTGYSVSFWRRQIVAGEIDAFQRGHRVRLKLAEVIDFVESGKMDVPISDRKHTLKPAR